MVNPAYTIIL